MRIVFLLFFVYLGLGAMAQDTIQNPVDFLPTDYSKKFTPHHLVVDYFKYVAENSKSVVFQKYGLSQEQRPLCIAIVSSPENIQNLESIRLNNLKLTGLEKGVGDVGKAKSIVWVNFGVHGNEPGATESSLQILYDLTQKDEDWLQDVIVILNPSLNPDGFNRYVSWNRQVSHDVMMPNKKSREHLEPWPTGRGNHFYRDLNRDWAWGTQSETRDLLKIYHEWMPHIVPDLHEQHPGKHYFFAPAVEPIHEYISDFQKDFQTTIGDHNAEVFDKRKWLYFTGEIFDMFYPGYGDTYPSFNGAIGMTYEQGGHGVAGQKLRLENGSLLSIEDRIEHHVAAVLATIETAKKYNKEILVSFANYFKKSQETLIGKYQGYVIKKGRSVYRMEKLKKLLDLHHIEYGSVRYSKDAVGYDYENQNNTSFAIHPGDLVIPAKQAMGVIANVLLEPVSHLTDSMTYDISAWSLPFVFNLEAYAVGGVLPDLNDFPRPKRVQGIVGMGDYAWVVSWKDISSARMLNALLEKRILVRYSQSEFKISGKEFQRGTLVITRADNRMPIQQLKRTLEELSITFQLPVFAQASGNTEKGPDFGSDKFKLVTRSKVGVVFGPSINAYSYGEVWAFLDKELKIPFVALPFNELSKNAFMDLNILIFPKGSYENLDAMAREKIKKWVSLGGRLILLETACKTLNIGEFELAEKEEDTEVVDSFAVYANEERDALLNSVPGGIVKVVLDITHPLAFGYEDFYYSLKTEDFSFDLLKDGHTVGRTPEVVSTLGYFGRNFKAHLNNNMIFGVRTYGNGQVVYFVDNPLFRGFWEGGKLMVANALFFR